MTTETNIPARTTAPPDGTAADPRLLDRLVDGELDEPDRRRLLLALDAEPGGWRRCALAFLEALAWQQAVRSASIREGAGAAGPSTSDRRGRGRRSVGRTLALAAAVFIAFGVGVATRPATQPGGGYGGPAVLPAGGNRLAPAPRDNTARPVPPDLWLTASDGSGRPVPVRLFAAAGGSGAAPVATQPVIPDYLRLQLERQGYEVRNDRRVVSVALKDGRTATVPVETVQYRFVGQRVY